MVAKDSKKAAKGIQDVDNATSKANKSRGKYQKQEKGIGQAGLSSAKSFSKMSSGISGGLVPAYAVLAANVFAVTAAFGALSRAAKVEQLTQGLTVLGTASGIAMKTLSSGLRDATDNALSLEDAMRGVALATSAGFDSQTIERLGTVAKNTSNALGRNLLDSFDRLVKGATKLEPELLDELGIMVRLDDATQTYAEQNGKLASALTLTERRQAFMNAVLEEGESKFGALGTAVDASPFDKLAATFTDLSTTLLNMLNNILVPVVAVLSASPMALFGTLLMFGTGIAKVMVPALFKMADGLRDVTTESVKQARQTITAVGATETRTKAGKILAAEIAAGTQTEAHYTAAIVAENREIERNTTLKMNNAAMTDQANASIENSTVEMNRFADGLIAEKASHEANQEVVALDLIQQKKYREGLKAGFKDMRKTFKQSKKNAVGVKFLGRANLFLARSSVFAAAGVRLLGTALLTMLPYIGLIIMAVGALVALFKYLNELFKSDGQKKYEEATSKLTETLGELKGSFYEVDKAMTGESETIKTVVQRYEALGNAVNEVNQLTKEVAKNADDMGRWDKMFNSREPIEEISAVISASSALTASFEKLHGPGATLNSVMKGLPLSQLSTKMQEFQDHTGQAAQTIAALAEAVKAANTPINSFLEKLKMKTSFDDIVDAFKGITEVALTAGDDSADGFISAFVENASQAQLDLLGINPDTIKLYKNELRNIEDSRKHGLDDNVRILEAGFAITKQKLTDQLTGTTAIFVKLQETERLEKKRQKTYKDDLKIAKARKYETVGATESFKQQNNIIESKAKILDAEITAQQELLKTSTDKLAIETNIGLLEKQAEAMRATALIEEQENVMIAQNALNLAQVQNKVSKAGLDMANKMLAAKKASLDADIQIAQLSQKSANREDPYRANADLTSADNLKIEKDFYAKKLTNANVEYSLTMTRINMEYALLGAQLHLLKEQMNVINAKYKLDNKTEDNLVDTGALDTAISGLDGTKVAAQDAAGKVFTALIGQINEDLAGAKDTALADSIGATGSVTDRIMALFGEGGALNSETEGVDLEDKVAGYVNALQPMLDIMGPEGALMQSVVSAATVTTEAWGTAFDKMGVEGASGMDKAAAAAEAASATVGAIGNMMAASSAGRISAIDDEISAEQKRDGKSAASVAKIKKMEAKKEALKKKAFETDKKVKMAQTVMNTAAGIMEFMSKGDIGMAVATGIMGAIQLATIAGTSYKGGGGSSPSAAVPNQVGVGSRSASVDLAKGNNAGGEQAYMRGAAGVGNSMTNFRPAFTGAKYRASGGETAGFMVGEQGPEMFIPDRAGRIAPADETANMNNAPTNINFSISAVDSQGVEELLINQKGNIIKMIREAANEHGEFFLEAVQEKTY